MTANEYIEVGHLIEVDGWTITLSDEHSGGQCPVAIHHDTGRVLELEWYNFCSWSQDWATSPLDYHWDEPAKLIEDLQAMLDAGLLRVEGAIHGLPGASPLGALLC